MKKIFSLLLTISLPFMVNAQDCNIPEPFDGNTGSNMTVMFTPGATASFPADISNDAYVVAISETDGLLVGSVPVEEITPLGTISVWGDDSSTNDVDGASAGVDISFQLVDGETLYDISLSEPVTYVTNGMITLLSASITQCVAAPADVEGCMDANADNYNADATVQGLDQYGNIACNYSSCDDIPDAEGCYYEENYSAFKRRLLSSRLF